ncbi:MAG: TonB C-terminal domain-containing protein [Nitrosomonadaceae bacterium]|nr:TonB C-terminal domain-containing protein [Nitrosomonadaceae bacterium]
MSAIAQPDSVKHDRLLQAGVLALLVHVGFFIFMTFGLNWKTHPPEGVVVDLWSSLPEPPKPPVQKVKPLPPKPVQPPKKVKPLPPKPEKLTAPTKPDIALKKEKIKKPKPKPVEQKQKIDKKQKARVAAEVERLQKEHQEEEERRLQKKAAGAQAAVKHNLIDEYKAKILAKIKSNIRMPTELPGNPIAEFDVTLLPGGEILDVRLRTSSGFTAFDRAVERAIVLSRPLPVPPNPLLFPNFRNLSLKVHYLE